MSETEMEDMQLIESNDSSTHTEQGRSREKDMDDNSKDYASGGRVHGGKSEDSPFIMEARIRMY